MALDGQELDDTHSTYFESVESGWLDTENAQKVLLFCGVSGLYEQLNC